MKGSVFAVRTTAMLVVLAGSTLGAEVLVAVVRPELPSFVRFMIMLPLVAACVAGIGVLIVRTLRSAGSGHLTVEQAREIDREIEAGIHSPSPESFLHPRNIGDRSKHDV